MINIKQTRQLLKAWGRAGRSNYQCLGRLTATIRPGGYSPKLDHDIESIPGFYEEVISSMLLNLPEKSQIALKIKYARDINETMCQQAFSAETEGKFSHWLDKGEREIRRQI